MHRPCVKPKFEESPKNFWRRANEVMSDNGPSNVGCLKGVVAREPSPKTTREISSGIERSFADKPTIDDEKIMSAPICTRNMSVKNLVVQKGL